MRKSTKEFHNKISKSPHKRVLKIIEGFHEFVKIISIMEPDRIVEVINDYQEFYEVSLGIRNELQNMHECIIEEFEDKRKILCHIDQMKPLIEKMNKMKAFW